MDIALIIIGIILLLLGIAGSILPVLPGPTLGYIALLLLQFSSLKPFGVGFLVAMAIAVAVVTLLDYLVPAWGTKKFGGTKSGTWGATLGLIAGILFLPPIGIIVGPFVGAFLGELLAGRNDRDAFRSAFGSFLGFLAGTFIKLLLTLIMSFYFIRAIL